MSKKQSISKDAFNDKLENINLSNTKNYYKHPETKEIVHLKVSEKSKIAVDTNKDLTDDVKSFLNKVIDFYILMNSKPHDLTDLYEDLCETAESMDDEKPLNLIKEVREVKEIDTTLLNDEVDIVYTLLINENLK